jgi:hypothetical protein
MKISAFKQLLSTSEDVNFMLPDGSFVPAHFHITELGLVTKHFIDCGGTVRHEQTASLQIWNANDVDHRLTPEKLLKIIAISEKTLELGDPEVEFEYQTETIGKYGLHFNGEHFVLTAKHTACLAGDSCGTPAPKKSLELSSLTPTSCCTPGSGCC